MRKKLIDYHTIHKDKTIVVCGCGHSLKNFKNNTNLITIGVNDVGRLFTPTYLVVLNPETQFKDDRFQHVAESKAEALFTQLNLPVNHPNIIRFQLGKRGGTDFSNPHVLHYTQNSPYVALCLAIHMGARKIGLIGVDFTIHHFFEDTGKHPLNLKFNRINNEYKKLGEAAKRHGIQIYNYSEESRLTAFEKRPLESLLTWTEPSIIVTTISNTKTPLAEGSDEKGISVEGNKENQVNREKEAPPIVKKVVARKIIYKKKYRIFFVNFNFISCGSVFTDGLQNAAKKLDIETSHAYWDDRDLHTKVITFNPDLIFVVHGRKFSQRFKDMFKDYNTAVWLLDEPYEVDNTIQFSKYFKMVFVNDPNTIQLHTNACYLPVCYDLDIYNKDQSVRIYATGFIGGFNSQRERLLTSLYQKKLLSYVIGGPWKSEELKRICFSNNVPHTQTAKFYNKTKIVINIFREKHHFNVNKIPAVSCNPRIYEALACGALVISEYRPEIKTVFPELPTFKNEKELIELVHFYLHSPQKLNETLKACQDRLSGHTYKDRLIRVMEKFKDFNKTNDQDAVLSEDKNSARDIYRALFEQWVIYGDLGNIKTSDRNKNSIIQLQKNLDTTPGSERGLISIHSFKKFIFSFDVKISNTSSFIVKVLQQEQFNMNSSSCYVQCDKTDLFSVPEKALRYFSLKRDSWEKVKIIFDSKYILLYANNNLICQYEAHSFNDGYLFIGTKGGAPVKLKNIAINTIDKVDPSLYSQKNKNTEEFSVLIQNKVIQPEVSIITTVYDRVTCLKNCIRSVQHLRYKNYEHIIVSDCPPPKVMAQIVNFIEQDNDCRITFVNLAKRYNNWGIRPASVGLKLSRGKYICFLSDDNGYSPDHIMPLVDTLNKNPQLGFVYSSCLYAGRGVLNVPIPKPGRIDLGQPMFRKELFPKYLNNTLPFDMFAWDWYMIKTFMDSGVKWKHINNKSFLFRLKKYPQYIKL